MTDLYSISILTLVVILAFGIVSLLVLAYVFGFTMTNNLTEETRILELCMNLDAYIPNCEMLYANVPTDTKNYGDKIE